jgi:hypothetical protein
VLDREALHQWGRGRNKIDIDTNPSKYTPPLLHAPQGGLPLLESLHLCCAAAVLLERLKRGI